MALVKLNTIVSASLVKVSSIAMAGISKILGTAYSGGAALPALDLSVSVNGANQDGHCTAGGGGYDNGWDGEGAGNVSGNAYYLFFRFTNIIIPNGATINSAVVRFTAKTTQSNTTVYTNVFFEDRADTITPASGSAINNAPLTSPAIVWDSLPTWTASSTYDTPSLVAPLQDIIDKAGWVYGNSVVLQVRDDGSTSNAFRSITAYDFSAGDAAELIVNYDYTYEDLTTYTENDQGNDITVTVPKADFALLEQQMNSYLYYDHGVDHFGDFEIQFDSELTYAESDGGSNNAAFVLCAVGNTVGTWPTWDTANDTIMVDTYYISPNLTTRIRDFSNDNTDTYSWGAVSTFAHHYFTFKRVSTTTTLQIYSDSARLTLVDTLTITSDSDEKRYLYALGSRDSGGNYTCSGYTQNFNIITAS